MRVIVAIGAFAVVLLIVVTQVFYTLDQTDQAIVTRVGVYQRTETQPGLKIKVPFAETVYRLDRRLLRYDATPSEFLTAEKKALVIDSYARYRIVEPRRFFEALRTEAGALARLEALISSEIREEVASHDQIEVIRDRREELMREVTARAAEKAREFGIEIVDVRIVGADFPSEVANSVYDRMRSERVRAANRFRAEGVEEADRVRAAADLERRTILAQAEERAASIRGEGEAEAIRVLGEAVNLDREFFSFVRTLEAYEKAVKDGTTLVIPSDSDFYQFLTDPYPIGSPERR